MILLVPLAVPVILALAAMFACLADVFKGVEHRAGLTWILFRVYVTGHHLDGRDRTDRGWVTRGTRSVHGPHYRTTRLARAPRAHRIGLAWLVTLVLVYGLLGVVVARTITEVLACTAVVLAAGFGLWRGGVRFRYRAHRRHVIVPLAAKLAGELGVGREVARRMVGVHHDADLAKPGDVVGWVRNLPDDLHLSDAKRQNIKNIFDDVLPVEGSFAWQMHKHPARLLIRCAATAPPVALLEDWAAEIDQLPRNAYLLAISAGDRLELFESGSESPHGAMLAKTRNGKSNQNLNVAATDLRRGKPVTCIDPKGVSLTCLAGVPGFILANNPRDVAGMRATIAAFRARMESAIDDGDTGRGELLILEEIPMLADYFKDYWLASKEPGDLASRDPAWDDIRAVLRMGAQFGFTVWCCGQELRQQHIGNSRSAFQLKLMGAFDAAQWRYIVGPGSVPPQPGKPGRFYVTRGSEHRLAQGIVADPRKGHGDDNEAGWREFALGGITAPPAQPQPWWESARPPSREMWALPAGERLAIPGILVGNEAGAAYVGKTPGAFRKARCLRPVRGEFRSDDGRPCWTRATLDLWVSGVTAPVTEPVTQTGVGS